MGYFVKYDYRSYGLYLIELGEILMFGVRYINYLKMGQNYKRVYIIYFYEDYVSDLYIEDFSNMLYGVFLVLDGGFIINFLVFNVVFNVSVFFVFSLLFIGLFGLCCRKLD